MGWDVLIMVFAIWNSILIPLEVGYAYTPHVVVKSIDYSIDGFFVLDIFFNFWTIYMDSKTDEPVRSGRRICVNYVMKGRFWVDIMASMPFETIGIALRLES